VSETTPVLVLDGVHAGYGDRTILTGVDLVIEPATVTTLIGANGAGKSTLLKTVFGLTKLTRGTIAFDGSDITNLSPADRLKAGICLVAQGRVNFAGMTVRENLEMAAYLQPARLLDARMHSVFELFPVLRTMSRSLAGNLSGGEQQLLETGMALMSDPRLLLIDEPSLGLSAKMQYEVFGMMTQLRDTGTTVLMVEQNAVQALSIADRGVVMELGRVGAQGSGAGMLEDPAVRRAYLGL
jgi:ABC-type branched-subunit amino acid transport system ATPase component